MDLLAAERDGNISEIRLPFSRTAGDIKEAERFILDLVQRAQE